MAVATGERRIVSVLVADLANSTGIAEQLGAERAKFLFDEVARLMSEQVGRFGGTVAQLTGDGLLALFGAPVAHEDDSERAVRAGLAIQRALADYARDVEAAYGVELTARVGVNTGPVVVSGADEDGDLRYNALGDAVNVAARLQTVAGEGSVAVGPTTARQVETFFDLEPLGELELKGKAAPVTSFRVTGVREEEPTEPELPLVGRDFELTVLERTMDGVVEGRGAIVSLIGEPGIGKSRLAAEVRRRYRDRVRFIEGRAVSYAQSFPYWPVRDLLREWLGVGATTPEARVRLELKAQLSELFREETEEAYPFFASLMGVTLEPDAAERLREINREAVQRRTFELFFEFACRLGQRQPVCLVLEDLHWADESTLELLEEVLGVTEESAVALFLLYRAEHEHGSWRLGERARSRFPHRYREIELRPLPADASRVLAANAAGGELPTSVADVLAERAGGNPFFLEEALRDLMERGALRRDDGRWELAVGVDELAVPALLHAALQARLDRLDPETREILSLAAVIGRTFGMPLLERLAPHEQLMRALSELQRLDLIVEVRRRPAPEYRFRHGLVQEVAYARLIDSTRRRLHLRVGEALEELYDEWPEEAPYALLARHFSEADEPSKAVDYLLKAGDAARAIYADEEALEHYRKAREFLARVGDERRSRDTLFKMALAHHLAFDFEGAEDVYDEAFCCKVEEAPRAEPTVAIETAITPPDEVAPGVAYSTDSAYFTHHLFSGLLMIDQDLNVLPALADNFRVSGDGLTYLFRLREGLRWSDGVPLTAEDFAFAYRQIREEQARTAFLMEDIETAEALDERTLELRLREPRNYFPYLLASGWAFPWPRHKCRELGSDWRKPEHLVGNGPFRLAEFDSDHALLVANEHWLGPRGNVREIRVAFTETMDEALDEWADGRYDVLQIWTAVDGDVPDTVAETVPDLGLQYIGFCADRSPFSNELVRKAFSHAVDRETLAHALSTLARAASLGGAIPPAMPGHSHRVAPEFDLELARRLLAEAGYPEGRGLPEIVIAAPPWLDPPDALIEQWQALGARVRALPMPGPLTPADLEAVHCWFTGWTADYPDPDGFFRGFFEVAWPFYRDRDLDELLARARSLTDQAERMRLYHEVDRLWVAERAAILPVLYPRRMLLRRPSVHGLWANPLKPAQLDEVTVTRS
jgi:ABC-type transport system substrate-binding protein/class 3 adenylate cyclase